jgi:uncharacterized membrane protein
MPTKATAPEKLPAARQWRSHLRLFAAAIVGAGAGYFAPGTIATRALIGWDVAAAIWLASAFVAMALTSAPALKKMAYKEDETASAILVVLVCIVVASLGGVIVEMGAAAGSEDAVWYTLLAIGTIVLSWTFMHTLFAIHYAHRFYGGRTRKTYEAPDGGFGLPGPHDGVEKNPGYFDFVYIAFCIGMTCQVSDVDVLTRDFRRLITVHAVLSFFYNIFILGLAVSLFGSLRAP